jgi:hypothetical protein
MAKPLRSLRLSPKSDYTRFTGNRGEIFYDPVNNTLRIFNSQTAGGEILATRSWVLDNTSDLTVNSLSSDSDINIDINVADSTLQRWRFGEDGELTVPGPINGLGNNKLEFTSNIGAVFSGSNGNTISIYANDGDIGGSDNINIFTNTAGEGSSYKWTFGTDGSLTFPDATVQTTAWTGIPGPYADDEAATLAGVALGSPYHKTGTNGQVFVRLTSPT